MAGAITLDTVNRPTWTTPDAVGRFLRAGWTDPGEAAAIDSIRTACADQPILDLGVGAGRTVPLMKAISDDYVGIDYARVLVDCCRSRHPGTRVEYMDARDLSAFADGSFGLVSFSYNGIDSVDHAGRLAILREVQRVLRPGGRFVFSAHNLHGPGFGETLWPLMHFTANPLKLGWRVLHVAMSLHEIALSCLNIRRNRRLHHDGDGWAARTAAAHHFGVVALYTSLQCQLRQLGDAGFVTDAVFDDHGKAVPLTETAAPDAWWFHLVARKPDA